MTELLALKAELQAAIDEIEAYEAKITKAASARIRKIIGNIKNMITPTRAALVAADKS